jgi:hypothetical protein
MEVSGHFHSPNFPLWKELQYPLYLYLGVPQSRTKFRGEAKYLLPLSGVVPKFTARGGFAMVTELARMLNFEDYCVMRDIIFCSLHKISLY